MSSEALLRCNVGKLINRKQGCHINAARPQNIAARCLRAKASSNCNQEVLCSIILTIVNGAEIGNRA